MGWGKDEENKSGKGQTKTKISYLICITNQEVHYLLIYFTYLIIYITYLLNIVRINSLFISIFYLLNYLFYLFSKIYLLNLLT